jgi:hypothetical protein
LTAIQDELTYSQPSPVLSDPTFRYDFEIPALFVDIQGSENSRVNRYRVLLIDEETNKVVLSHDVSIDEGPPLMVPLVGIPENTYRVQVDVVGQNGQLLASVEGVTTYLPPPAPGFLQRVASGMSRNPLIILSIVFIVLAIIILLSIRWIWERRLSGTPVLEGGGLQMQGSNSLPLKQTMVGLNENGSPPAVSAQHQRLKPPGILLTIKANPDKNRVGQKFVVEKYPFTIGRANCDLVIAEDPLVSRKHVEIRWDESGVHFVDPLI